MRMTVFGRIIAISGFTLSSLLAQEEQRKIADADGDGWCDLWCDLFKEIQHRNKRVDTDGDGLTDFQEMMLMRNPLAAERDPRDRTPEEAAQIEQNARGARERSAREQARIREILRPYMVEPVLDGDGNPTGRESRREAKRKLLAQRLPQISQKELNDLAQAKVAAKNLGKPEMFKLPQGGVAVLSGVRNGAPQYFHSRSSLTAAESISVSGLWPGGASGLDLDGVGDTPIRLGIWEPLGPIVDHPEFSLNVVDVDPVESISGWGATLGGGVLATGIADRVQQGIRSLSLVKQVGFDNVLYSRQHGTARDFTDQTVLVWYYLESLTTSTGNPVLAQTPQIALRIRFGSSPNDYWERDFTSFGISSGWNLLSMSVDNSSRVVGNPDMTACNYTALQTNLDDNNFAIFANAQCMDHWRLADTRFTNMDGTGTIGDHSTHVSGLMISRGNQNNAIGMAFNAELQGRNATMHLTELSEIWTNNDNQDDIFTSNHSYGPNPGWRFESYPTGIYPTYDSNGVFIGNSQVPAGTWITWGGDELISGTEDHTFGRYTDALSGEIDSIVYAEDSLLPVWAAGNDRGDQFTTQSHFEFSNTLGEDILTAQVRTRDGGNDGFDTMPPDSVAKNILTIGSVEDVTGGFSPGTSVSISAFSSFGPTDDGRIKPDVCANGDLVESAAYDDPNDPNDNAYAIFSGTSQAAPSVAGSLGLVAELMRRYRGDAYQPSASLLKGLMIHTADDILNAGPDYKSGWGLLNATSAANLVRQSEETHQGQNVRMVTVANGSSVNIPVVATGGEPLKVTVVSTDPKGTATGAPLLDNDTKMLVNDFSLIVSDGISTYHPFSLDKDNPDALATTNGPNDKDNVEQVIVATPTAGTDYTITIEPASGETFVDELGQNAPQEVAVIISGIDPDPSLELIITSVLQTGADKFTLVWSSLAGSTYRVQQSSDLTVGSFIDLTAGPSNLPVELVAPGNFTAYEVTSDPATITKNFWRVRKVE